MRFPFACFATFLALFLPLQAMSQTADPLTAPYPADRCPSCEEWNKPHAPLRIFGNTYFVGTEGVSSILITSPEGHVLIDGGIPASAPQILQNVRTLGFRVEDIKLLLSSHVHFDHVGGLAAIQRASGARLAASAPSVPVLRSGRSGPDDPQYGVLLEFPAASVSETVAEGQTLRVGPLALTAHITAGHTPGGTSWSWRSCEDQRCVDIVYADSQTPISADGFRYSDSKTYPSAVADFQKGFATLERLPCDILLTPHPSASALWDRVSGGRERLIDPGACKRYAASARTQLQRRLEKESKPEVKPEAKP
jgi:metallo-beta-lactamase class B